GDAEAVDEVASGGRAQILSDLLQIEVQLGDLLPVDVDLRLRLIDLHVDRRREIEQPARCSLLLELLRELEDLRFLRGGGDDELHREGAAAWERRRHHGEGLDSGDLRDPLLDLGKDLGGRALPLVPRLEPYAPEPAAREGDLEGELRLR